jgi:hypothetical protein
MKIYCLPIGEVFWDDIIHAKPSLSYGVGFTHIALDDYAFRKEWIKLELVPSLPLMLSLAYFFL